MAIFPKSVTAAKEAVTKAEQTVSEWESKAAAARAEAAELDANSGALILDDPAQAERISIQVNSLERTARAYDGAAAESRDRLNKTHVDALAAEATEEDKGTRDAEKKLTAHNDKVAGLLSQLQDVDGCEYMPDQREKIDDETGRRYAKFPKSVLLANDVRHHKMRAATIRYYLDHGEIPSSSHLLDVDLGLGFHDVTPELGSGDFIPASVYAARDAGIVPVVSVGA